MKNALFFCCLLLAATYYLACQPGPKDNVDVNIDAGTDTTEMAKKEAMVMTSEDSVRHGEYLVQVIGCDHCHSPKMMTDRGPEPNPELSLSGHPAGEALPPADKKMATSGWLLFNPGLTAYIGPWGTSYSANLTPDPSGLGNWTYSNFEKAMREGKFKGLDSGRMLLPPMPWQSFKLMSDRDLQCIWKYLRTIKPVSNVVPAAAPPM